MGMMSQSGVVVLVDAVIVQDHVNLFSGRKIGDHAIHECEKLHPALLSGRLCMNGTGRDFQCGKQIEGAMTLVGALEPANDCPTVGFNIARLPF